MPGHICIVETFYAEAAASNEYGLLLVHFIAFSFIGWPSDDRRELTIVSSCYFHIRLLTFFLKFVNYY